jgi:carbon storage regulator
MLVIRRRSGESFVVGGEIHVEILDVEGSQVKLGIRAPREISILRSEVLETRQVNQAAVQHGAARAETLAGMLKQLRPPAAAPNTKISHNRKLLSDMPQ